MTHTEPQTQPQDRHDPTPRPRALRVLAGLVGAGALGYAALGVVVYVSTQRAYAQAGPEDDTSLYGIGDLAAGAAGVLSVALAIVALLGWGLSARRHGAAASVLGVGLAIAALPLTLLTGLLR